jgi:hypothetical protein
MLRESDVNVFGNADVEFALGILNRVDAIHEIEIYDPAIAAIAGL